MCKPVLARFDDVDKAAVVHFDVIGLDRHFGSARPPRGDAPLVVFAVTGGMK